MWGRITHNFFKKSSFSLYYSLYSLLFQTSLQKRLYCVHSPLSHSAHLDSTYTLIFSHQSTDEQSILSEIINIFLDAQSNGDLETSSHLIGFLSGDRHTFLFETQFPRFHFSSYVSNISCYSSLVTNFRSCVSALLLDFKISQDFVYSFPSFPSFWSVLSPLFQALDFINHRAANGSKNSLLPPFFLLSSRDIDPIAYTIWVFLPIFQSQQVLF